MATSDIIGLSGYAQSGKDTLASFLVEDHGYVRIAFADALRECVYALNPYVHDTLRLQQMVDESGWDNAKQDIEVRRLLQVIGTEVGRDIIDQDVWLNIAKRKVLEARITGKRVVLTDVRFPNEYDLIYRLGGMSYWVSRPGVGAVNTHVSENALAEKVFQLISNDGSLSDLAALAHELAR